MTTLYTNEVNRKLILQFVVCGSFLRRKPHFAFLGIYSMTEPIGYTLTGRDGSTVQFNCKFSSTARRTIQAKYQSATKTIT